MKQTNSSNELWNVFYHEFLQYIQLMLIWKKTSLNLALRKQPQSIVTFIHLEQNLQSHSVIFLILLCFLNSTVENIQNTLFNVASLFLCTYKYVHWSLSILSCVVP